MSAVVKGLPIQVRGDNERAFLELVDRIVRGRGYESHIGYFGKYSIGDDEGPGVLLGWEKWLDVDKHDHGLPGLFVGLERLKDESSDEDADFLGEYWQPTWSVRVWVPETLDAGQGARHKMDSELSRDFITLLEAVELLPRTEAAAVASYPHLIMKAKGEA